MKNLFKMAIISLAILNTSCKKDENNSIEGTQSVTRNDGSKEELSECAKKSTMTFSSGKVTEVKYDYDNLTDKNCIKFLESLGSYTIVGNKITIEEENEKPSTAEFSVSGNTLTVVSDGETLVFKRK